MKNKVLITGGAGFIGSYLADELIKKGCQVTAYDKLVEQVHGKSAKPPSYMDKNVKFIHGDMCDRNKLKKAVFGTDIIFHMASRVGVGQSMYEIEGYTRDNILGTAVLLDILANEKHTLKKLIVASSMSIYGEGPYSCPECGTVYPSLRKDEDMSRGDWEPKCVKCSKVIEPLPTSEDKPLLPTSVYAVSKRDQEEMCLAIGRAYKIPVVALRYFNTYGPRQALSNPYTGAAAIFSSRILNKKPPVIFEDGMQSRDFVHVSDIVRASILASLKKEADYEVFNVGTGRKLTVLDLASILTKKLKLGEKPLVTGKFRSGDIRHCYADISKIEKVLGFKPAVKFEDGVEDLIRWVKTENPKDLFDKAVKELDKKKLRK